MALPRHGWTCKKIESDEDIEAAAQEQRNFPNEEKAQFLWHSTGAVTAKGRLLDEEADKYPKVLIEDVLGTYEKMLRARDVSAMKAWDTCPSQFS